ncbi:MAG: hypothetical protein AAB413_04995 [Patescibacteria group bacterium]
MRKSILDIFIISWFFITGLSFVMSAITILIYNDGRTPAPTLSSSFLGYSRFLECRLETWELHGVGNEGRSNSSWTCSEPWIKRTDWAEKVGWPDNTITRSVATGTPFLGGFVETVILFIAGFCVMSVLGPWLDPSWRREGT